jgi:uncharacterized caspase-like protein
MRAIWQGVAAVAALWAAVAAGAPGERVALLIGNNAYPVHPLRNAANDARDLGAALRECGFKPKIVLDATAAEMRAAVDEFSKEMIGAEAAFFFFAGHSFQIETRMYMMPIDVPLTEHEQALAKSLEITAVLGPIQKGSPLASFVVLDMNRDSLSTDAGTGKAYGDPPIPPNTMAVYATSPGGVAQDGFGSNGMYTKHLLKHLRTPGIQAEVIFKRARQGVMTETRRMQIPQESSSLARDFVFVAAPPDAPAPRMVLAPPSGERRVALVIGNNAYKVGPLVNPVNDADDIAKALERSGFRTIVRKDAGQREIRAAIREFQREMLKSDVGLFYFAGHGLQIRGTNFLVPVDADLQSEADAEDQSVDANFVVRVLEEAQAKVGIVILDACRNNPLPRSVRAPIQGLAQMNAATGTLIAFATAPGSTASDGTGTERNGVYAKHLLQSLEHDDSDVLKVFQRTRAAVVKETKGRQIPWESTSLMGDFRFRVPTPAK